MEFTTDKKQKRILNVATVIIVSSSYFGVFYSLYKCINDFNGLFNMNIDKINFLVDGSIGFILWLLLFIYLANRFDEKIVIDNNIIKYFRKNFAKYKQIDSILISDIKHVLDTVTIMDYAYRMSNGQSMTRPTIQHTYSAVDNLDKNILNVKLTLYNEEGIEFFNYLRNELKLKQETIERNIPKAKYRWHITVFIAMVVRWHSTVIIAMGICALVWCSFLVIYSKFH